MNRLELPRSTLRLHRRWTAVAIALSSVTAIVPLLAGGTDPWFRLLTGTLTVGGTLTACRFRTTLHLPIVAGLAGAALLPDDATVDASVVVAISAVSLVLAAESVAVARRLVTAAPVSSTRRDRRALVTLALASSCAVGFVAMLSRLDGVAGGTAIVGLPLAAVALAVTFIVRRPTPSTER